MKWLDRWILFWVELAASLVGIATFGFVHPSWEIGFCRWTTLRYFEKQKRKEAHS